MTHTNKYSFPLAIVFNAVVPGVISFVFLLVISFILGFVEGFTGVPVYTHMPQIVISAILAASLFFSVKFLAKYINTRFVIVNKNVLALVSFILLILGNSAGFFLGITDVPGELALKFGFVLGVLSIKAFLLSPFYIASLIYIKNNHASAPHVKPVSILPGYVKIVLTILIAWYIFGIVTLALAPTGFEGYVVPLWYTRLSMGLLAIQSLGIFLLYFRRKLGFFIALVISLTSLIFDYIADPSHIVIAIFGTMIPVAILYAVLKPSWSKLN